MGFRFDSYNRLRTPAFSNPEMSLKTDFVSNAE
jgi:hypothetical protein